MAAVSARRSALRTGVRDELVAAVGASGGRRFVVRYNPRPERDARLSPDGDTFLDEIQPVYDEIGATHPPYAPPRPAPGELPDETAEIERSGLFTVAATELFHWTVDYDAEAYLRLLSTFSGHIPMSAYQRDRLCAEVRTRIAARRSRTITRGWGAVLLVATPIPPDDQGSVRDQGRPA
jgi:hypothetical protein